MAITKFSFTPSPSNLVRKTNDIIDELNDAVSKIEVTATKEELSTTIGDFMEDVVGLDIISGFVSRSVTVTPSDGEIVVVAPSTDDAPAVVYCDVADVLTVALDLTDYITFLSDELVSINDRYLVEYDDEYTKTLTLVLTIGGSVPTINIILDTAAVKYSVVGTMPELNANTTHIINIIDHYTTASDTHVLYIADGGEIA